MKRFHFLKKGDKYVLLDEEIYKTKIKKLATEIAVVCGLDYKDALNRVLQEIEKN